MEEFKIIPINVGHGESILVCICHNGKEFNLLIDGGSYCRSTDAYKRPIYNVESMKDIARSIVLHGLVVSHVDDDHIGGIIHIIKEWKRLDCERNFFLIFNDYIDHSISFSQGEVLINEIMKLQEKENMNIQIVNTYSKRYISANRWIQKYLSTLPLQVLSIFQRKMLLEKKNDYIYLTLLTPGKKEINALMQEWKKDKVRRGQGKRSSANGRIINDSSIAFLLEYGGRTVLFTGDSSIELIRSKLDELNKVIKHINSVNLCHHGAAENNGGILDFIKNYGCDNVFASTNSVKYLKHPCLFMLYKLVKTYPGLKIYLTNKLPCLEQQPEWDLADSKVFSMGNNADTNTKKMICNLIEMEFPPDQRNFEKFVGTIKNKFELDSGHKIEINKDKLVEAYCAEIKEELERAIENGKIVYLTKSYIAI